MKDQITFYKDVILLFHSLLIVVFLSILFIYLFYLFIFFFCYSQGVIDINPALHEVKSSKKVQAAYSQAVGSGFFF